MVKKKFFKFKWAMIKMIDDLFAVPDENASKDVGNGDDDTKNACLAIEKDAWLHPATPVFYPPISPLSASRGITVYPLTMPVLVNEELYSVPPNSWIDHMPVLEREEEQKNS